ncbi:MAG: FCD domain-containing protein [Propionibacteriales bacterium]|nr:FCD domain-containing protein [Propionibacteriales bacterium]
MEATVTHTDEAYEQLKRSILVCEFAPGLELRELGLVETTGRSRGAVRGALGRLVTDGLVDLRPRKGYRVSSLDLADVREVFEMRRLLEPYAVGLAAQRAPREAVESLHDLAHSRYDHADRASFEQYLVDNREFHVQIAEAAGNRRLAQALRALLEDMQRLLFLSVGARDQGVEGSHEHHDLYDAILVGDAARARTLCEAQIEQARERVIEALLDRRP